MTNTKSYATAVAVVATLGLAAACWILSVRKMNGMDMGVTTSLGQFTKFIIMWVLMMAAMMLPGAAPSAMRRGNATGQVSVVLLFVGSYLAVWALFGIPVYALYRPHGTLVAGIITIAAGIYELTPLKKTFRRRCGNMGSGFGFGLCCVGSSIGLMLMQVALGIMSITWMVVITIVIFAQKLLSPKAAIDVPLALIIIGLGILIVFAPSMVPGLMPSM